MKNPSYTRARANDHLSHERTREIGVLKAIGAKSRDILLLFIFEAIITGVIGGTIGDIFGALLSHVIGRFINITASTSLTLGIYVIGFAVITCILSGLYPARRAANLHPVEALRFEREEVGCEENSPLARASYEQFARDRGMHFILFSDVPLL